MFRGPPIGGTMKAHSDRNYSQGRKILIVRREK